MFLVLLHVSKIISKEANVTLIKLLLNVQVKVYSCYTHTSLSTKLLFKRTIYYRH